MFWFVVIGTAIIYFIGIGVYINSRTEHDFEYYDGGFLNMGYITSSRRDMTQKDGLLSLLWPAQVLLLLLKVLIWIINELVIFPCILLNFRYKDTWIYQKITEWM